MCVESCKGGALTRAEVIASIAGASLFAFGKPAAAAPKKPGRLRVDLPQVPSNPNPSPGALQAQKIATGSKLVMPAFTRLLSLAAQLDRAKLRDNLWMLLANPVPHYATRLRSASARDSLRQELLAAGFIDKSDTIDAFMPTEADDFSTARQVFFATPGSAQDSHHAYPGGLVMHELFNAQSAIALAENYNEQYFGGQKAVSRDVVVAAALYHDVMKTVVFQWGADGTLSYEPNIAGTGAHHVLSAAEAIARGHDAQFVTVVLSAHAAPSLGDEVKVVAWARAAAMVAGVDPVDFGLLKRKGDAYELAAVPPIEAFINNLSDHDYVLSVHAMHEVAPRIDAAVMAANVPEPKRLWHRNALLANTSAIGLYQTLAHNERAFRVKIEHELSKITL